MDHPIQKRGLDAGTKTVPSGVVSMQKPTQLPRIGSLLISAGLDSDECSLCGDLIEVGEDSDLSRTLPCVDERCVPCARMWKILSSPTCAGCYADFTCPKIATDRADLSAPHMDLDTDDYPQQRAPPDSQTFDDVDVDVDSDGVTMSYPGSPIEDQDDETTSVGELNDEDVQDALDLANNDAGTNFNIDEIKDEIPRSALRKGNKTQLADTLTQFLNLKAAANDADEGEGGIKSSPRCVYCQRYFRSIGYLRSHMQVHMIVRRTCQFCSKVLKNAASRRDHERKCQETDGDREERLRKATIARRKHREAEAGRKAQKQEHRERALKSRTS